MTNTVVYIAAGVLVVLTIAATVAMVIRDVGRSYRDWHTVSAVKRHHADAAQAAIDILADTLEVERSTMWPSRECQNVQHRREAR